ncbi:MAG: DNA polymerase III subunit beta [Dehalococcoidia bacterium]|nr:DNA polymerase III subunit beta [Dehalococcoidia bacterium]
MNVTCLQENLARGLGIVGRAVAVRSTLPITSNVLIATDHGRIKLAATNLDIALSCWIGGQIEEEGAITVPARLLADFVNSLPTEKIQLSLSPRSRQVKLVCARNEATIGGLDADDFPPIPAVDDGGTLEIDPKMLREAISQVVFSAATDDSRPVLTGIDLVVEGDQLTFAAADGFRLAVRHLQLQKKAAERQEVIVPAKALAELSRLLQDQEDPVRMTFNANKTQVLFALKDVELVAQLIQGTFPDYSRLIPKEWGSRAVVEVRDFLQETKIASIFARDGSGIVRITFQGGDDGTPGRMTIAARAEEIGDNSGELDAQVEGEPAKIAFNGRYLQDVLAVLDGGRVALETTGPSQPGVIRPLDNDTYVHVVMPMFVQW